MAKLLPHEIKASDLAEFLAADSDFAFELNILNRMVRMGFACEHAGTYEDPATKKLREFDIRAISRIGYASVHLAIECKQLRPHFPLLVLQVPRRADEAYHNVLMRINPDRVEPNGYEPAARPRPRGLVVRHGPGLTTYAHGGWVGKSCAQVGRDSAGITASDTETFAKWTQAISSAQSILTSILDQEVTDQEGWIAALVLPVVVVPDGRLWTATFDADGNLTGPPAPATRVSYYMNAPAWAGDKSTGCACSLSHVEFLTVSGLETLIPSIIPSDRGLPSGFFYYRELERAVRERPR